MVDMHRAIRLLQRCPYLPDDWPSADAVQVFESAYESWMTEVSDFLRDAGHNRTSNT